MTIYVIKPNYQPETFMRFMKDLLHNMEGSGYDIIVTENMEEEAVNEDFKIELWHEMRGLTIYKAKECKKQLNDTLDNDDNIHWEVHLMMAFSGSYIINCFGSLDLTPVDFELTIPTEKENVESKVRMKMARVKRDGLQRSLLSEKDMTRD